jgi:DNA polymerase-1
MKLKEARDLERGLFLIFDGNALVHRAFHALPPLTASKTGEPTGAVYGLARMLFKTLDDFKPNYWAIAFDRPTPTFRHIQFEAYKAQRPKTPDELRSQLQRARHLVKALNMPAFEIDGYEADDVLGTLAHQATLEGIETIIVTGDNDALQTISPKVRVLLPKRTFRETSLYDEAKVEEKYGLEPKQIPDFKALQGDPSDNIPGLRGIGEKTAVKLLQQFHSIEGIYQNIEQVSPDKLKETLRAGEAQARQNKELTTIVTEVPVSFNPDQCKVVAYDVDKLQKLFQELEFFSLAERLAKLPESEESGVLSPVVSYPTPDYLLVDNAAALAEQLNQLSRMNLLAIYPQIRQNELLGLALSLSPGRTYYLPKEQLSQPAIKEKLEALLSQPEIVRVAHNVKEMISFCPEINFDFDTMIAGYLLGEKHLEFEALAQSLLINEISPSAGRGVQLNAPTAQALIPQACLKADVIRKLHPLLEERLKERKLWQLFTEVEMPLIPVLSAMERNGVALNTKLLRELSQNLSAQLLKSEQEIYSYVGHQFNLNSPQQLSKVLFEELKLPAKKKTKSGYSTDASVLERLRGVHPIIELILEYRQSMKLKSTYVDSLPALLNPQTGRVHTNFNQTVTATGRLSSSEPNLQNIPVRGELGKQIRQAFIAQPPAFLIGGDYSQIELRILAHFSQDTQLLSAFEQDEDIHTATAVEVFNVSPTEVTPEMRRVAKTVNFGVIYGISDYGLEQATELSRQEADNFITAYFEKYPKVKEYLKGSKQLARQRGYVQTLLGRRRYIPEINSPNRQVREAAERMAINMPIQGTAADIIKIAMIQLHHEIKRRGLSSKMLLQVHDELLFEVPPEEMTEMKSLIDEIMPRAMKLSVPLKVTIKIGKNWGEME